MKNIKPVFLIILSFLSINCFGQVYTPDNNDWEEIRSSISKIYDKYYIPDGYFISDKLEKQKKVRKEIEKNGNKTCSGHDHDMVDTYIFKIHLDKNKNVNEVYLDSGDAHREGKFTEKISKSLKKLLKKVDPYPLDVEVEVLDIVIGFKPHSLSFQISPI